MRSSQSRLAAVWIKVTLPTCLCGSLKKRGCIGWEKPVRYHTCDSTLRYPQPSQDLAPLITIGNLVGTSPVYQTSFEHVHQQTNPPSRHSWTVLANLADYTEIYSKVPNCLDPDKKPIVCPMPSPGWDRPDIDCHDENIISYHNLDRARQIWSRLDLIGYRVKQNQIATTIPPHITGQYK